MNLPRILYITQDRPDKTHEQLAEEACVAGIKFIQLRVKNKQNDEVMEMAKKVKKITQKFGAILIINDHVNLVQEIDAAGVHLGKEDTHYLDARKVLGDKKMIGLTANTFDDIYEHANNLPTYFGLGPFRFTTTKEKLSPLLGLEGYAQIIHKMKEKEINTPIYAIGGILLEDVESILKTGVYGIALSGLISNASNKREIVQKIEEIIQKIKP